MNNTRKVPTQNLIILIVGILGIIAVSWKAAMVPMTIDESASYLRFVRNHLFLPGCVVNPDCWQTANNHWLNTLLMQLTDWVFGPNPFALRLPNVAAFVLYAYSAGRIIKLSTKDSIFTALGMTLFCFNPYVLDFFTVARGYGLGLALMSASMASLINFISTDRSTSAFYSILLSCLAVFSNLVFLMFLGGIISVVLIQLIKSKSISHFWRDKWLLGGVLSVILTLAFFAYPVMLLSNIGEFEFGAHSVVEMWTSYIYKSAYRVKFFGFPIRSMLSGLLLCLLAFSVISAIGGKKHPNLWKHRMVIILATVIMAGFAANFLIVGALWPNGRKAIILQPLIALLVFYALSSYNHWTTRVTAGLISIGASLVLLLAFNANAISEWPLDRFSKEVVEFIASECTSNNQDEVCQVATHHIMNYSTTFYALTQYSRVEIAPRSRVLTISDKTMYIYTLEKDTSLIGQEFELARRFRKHHILMRRK